MSACILHVLIDDVFHKECSARLAFGSCDADHIELLPYVVVKYPCDLRHGGAYIAYDDMRHIACIARIVRRFRYVCHSAREHCVLKVSGREMCSLAYKTAYSPLYPWSRTKYILSAAASVPDRRCTFQQARSSADACNSVQVHMFLMSRLISSSV